MNPLTKELGKAKREQDRQYKALFNKVRSKVRRFTLTNDSTTKLSKASKKRVLDDLRQCNNIELMHVLSIDEDVRSIKAYLETVNSFLQFEYETYDYEKRLIYNVGNMAAVTNAIIQKHRKLDAIQALRDMVHGK